MRSVSSPLVYLLDCRHCVHSLNFMPLMVLESKSGSSQAISLTLVVDPLASFPSPSLRSWQTDAHGDPGATWSAVATVENRHRVIQVTARSLHHVVDIEGGMVVVYRGLGDGELMGVGRCDWCHDTIMVDSSSKHNVSELLTMSGFLHLRDVRLDRWVVR